MGATISKFVTHSRHVLRLARRYGWLPGARYTNLRDVRDFDRVGFLDIDWHHYSFKRHIEATKLTRPKVTVARDVYRRSSLPRILDEAHQLLHYADRVLIVPKVLSLSDELEELVPACFDFGYSVPTRYGGTPIHPRYFRRTVHLLGGRPDVQRQLAEHMVVGSFDCNRFTLDAAYGDYFDGEAFRPHPSGGYDQCIIDSLRNINRLWKDYSNENGKS
jgi:hypothetical protein